MAALFRRAVIVGDRGVGKRTLFRSYAEVMQPSRFKSILGDSQAVIVTNNKGQSYKLSVSNTSGLEDYRIIRSMISYPGADVFVVCYAINNPASFQRAINYWIPEVASRKGAKIILVGTKGDTRSTSTEGTVPSSGGRGAAKGKGALFFEISSIEKVHLDALFQTIIDLPLTEVKPQNPDEAAVVAAAAAAEDSSDEDDDDDDDDDDDELELDPPTLPGTPGSSRPRSQSNSSRKGAPPTPPLVRVATPPVTGGGGWTPVMINGVKVSQGALGPAARDAIMRERSGSRSKSRPKSRGRSRSGSSGGGSRRNKPMVEPIPSSSSSSSSTAPAPRAPPSSVPSSAVSSSGESTGAESVAPTPPKSPTRSRSRPKSRPKSRPRSRSMKSPDLPDSPDKGKAPADDPPRTASKVPVTVYGSLRRRRGDKSRRKMLQRRPRQPGATASFDSTATTASGSKRSRSFYVYYLVEGEEELSVMKFEGKPSLDDVNGTLAAAVGWDPAILFSGPGGRLMRARTEDDWRVALQQSVDNALTITARPAIASPSPSRERPRSASRHKRPPSTHRPGSANFTAPDPVSPDLIPDNISVRSSQTEHIERLLGEYTERIQRDMAKHKGMQDSSMVSFRLKLEEWMEENARLTGDPNSRLELAEFRKTTAAILGELKQKALGVVVTILEEENGSWEPVYQNEDEDGNMKLRIRSAPAKDSRHVPAMRPNYRIRVTTFEPEGAKKGFVVDKIGNVRVGDLRTGPAPDERLPQAQELIVLEQLKAQDLSVESNCKELTVAWDLHKHKAAQLFQEQPVGGRIYMTVTFDVHLKGVSHPYEMSVLTMIKVKRADTKYRAAKMSKAAKKKYREIVPKTLQKVLTPALARGVLTLLEYALL